MENTNTVVELSPAERYYLSHKKSMSEYQERNRDKIKEYNKAYLESLKLDPERRQKYLDKKKEYYYKVIKPKLEEKKRKQNESESVELQSANIIIKNGVRIK
jgi:hypothetical protein